MTPRTARPIESHSCATLPNRRKSSRSARADSISTTCTRRPKRRKRHCAAHLALAAELDLPIVIHCRDAENRLIEIVRETGIPSRGGVIHCFTGDINAAREFLELGFCISFSGIITFKNAAAIREAATIVPDDRVMVETDSPYLAPEPYRGKRNEPAYVTRTLEMLANLRTSRRNSAGRTGDRECRPRVQTSIGALARPIRILTSPCPRRGRRKPLEKRCRRERCNARHSTNVNSSNRNSARPWPPPDRSTTF